MKQILLKTWLVMLMMCVGVGAWAESVTYTFADVASENSWTNATAYTDVTLGNFRFEVSGGGNNGKYYTTDVTWRFYSGGGLKISATDGATITSISSDPTVTFTDGATSFSSTVKIKSITINYTPVINYTITAATSNSTWGTVSLDGRVITASPKSGYRISKSNPYTVTSGTATVTDNKDNTFTVNASSNCTVQINFEAIPSYNYAFYSNGVKLSDGSKYEGEAIVFPADPEAINGKVFVGWAESTIDGTTNDKPVVVRSKKMGTVDVNFYAVFATQSGSGTESTSISKYADGEYYIVDFYDNKYYAFSGAVANKKLAGVEVTSAVTANPDGSISVNITNASLTDEMPYTISLSAGNYTITNTKAGSDVILQKGGNDLGTEVSDPAIYWTGFEEGTDAQAGRFSITATGTNSKDSKTNNCLLLQTSNWDSKASVQSPTLAVKGYVQSNRGNVTEKQQCYASGYMWFVPTTAISYSDYCTTVTAPTPTFASLDELIDAELEDETVVNVTLTDEEVYMAMTHPMIPGMYIVILKDQKATIAAPGVDLGWAQGGTVSGTLENVTWDPEENSLSSEDGETFWASLEYTAPAGNPKETITINSACTDGEFYYTTYSSANAWYVPEDLIVSEVGVVDGKLLVEKYNTGDLVPPYTGVLVGSMDFGAFYVDVETDYDMIDEFAKSVLGEDNALRPTCFEGGITADDMVAEDPGCEFFRLTMHNGTKIGFWWGAEDGAAFDIAANKAYLAVLGLGTGVKESLWFGDKATSIKNIANGKQNKVVFNLNGQRVSKTQKGLYITNGKKYMVK